MTNYEEPAAKILRMEVDSKEHEEEMDEGQEEWLSEDILTDDDCNPGADQYKSESNINASQEDTTPSLVDEDNPDNSEVPEKSKSQNIEQALDDLENSQQQELPGELGNFLVRKTSDKAAETKKEESDLDESTKHSDDDGHDTDELLRMLGDENQKTKKIVKKTNQKSIQEPHSSEDDDDEYIFEGAKVSRLKVAKNAIINKYPSKAVPEKLEDDDDDDDDDTDMSSDEAVTVKKMFNVVRRPANVACKSTAMPLKRIHASKPAPKKPSATSTPAQKFKSNVQIVKLKEIPSKIIVKNEPVKQKEPIKKKEMPIQMKRDGKEPIKKESIMKKESKVPTLKDVKDIIKKVTIKKEPDEIIDEDGFLEEDSEFDLDEDFESEPEEKGKQRIMRPEQMDEEVPTDGDSLSEGDEESIYDELPSSDSDEHSDWFTLDIRSERASEYVPLMGAKAHQLLLAEKQRVSAGITSLRQSISALNETSEQQTEMLRKATIQLAELDAALKV